MITPEKSRPWLKHYSSWVPAQLPLPTESMIDKFEASVERQPRAPALCYFDEIITFEILDDYASRFATLLEEWDVGRGDRVALFLQNMPQFVIALLGTWKRGAIVVPLNPMFKHKELLFHLQDSGTKILLCLESLYESCAKTVLPNTSITKVVTTSEIDLLSNSTAANIPTLCGIRKRPFSETIDFM